MTAEDKIHWGVLLVIAALAGVTFREPAPGPAATPGSPQLPRDWRAPASGATRAELDQAIARLSSAVERWSEPDATRVDGKLRVQALGQTGLDQRQPRADALASLFSSQSAPALEGPADTRPASASDRQPLADATPPERLGEMALLATLLEAGVPLEQPVPLPAGLTTLKQLVATALQEPEREKQPGPAPAEPGAWELDLLALATLGGERQYRERLAQAVQSSLTRLDRRQRALHVRQGTGALSPADLKQLARAWQDPEERAARHQELQLAAAVFRAVGVLVEPELERQARRYLNGLLFRSQTDRVLYEHLLSARAAAGEISAVRLDALEHLGRLEQALYGAHVSFRRQDRPAPAPQTAQAMREAAHDLLVHLEQLERAGVLQATTSDSPGSQARLRAVVHALRGLRAARIAT